ncbi:MAG: hypothetical protein JWQ90_274 [Hydrocarboniphaga sp.]|uniref:hypothetical protein n=1 Tax=Hydrocarboniphaga sp. TaxID=2033016 RepID=UPI00260955B1|nr:hypothetical protein [Hydrocarboniphaga sp.]MDB5967824.1 hypothetical protein [Hydrocarboniphaga sp.]
MILQLLNVLIGLTLVYLIFSTIASAIFELLEGLIRQRGKLLAKGVKEILGRLSPDPLADLRRFYEQPLISSLYEGDFAERAHALPSYIPPEHFARAVLMLAEDAAGAANAGTDPFVRLREFAQRLVGQRALAQGESYAQALEAEIVAHFNASMDRVGGWFGRYARAMLLGIGLALAVFANVDSIQIVRTLAMDPQLADRIADSAAQYVEQRSQAASGAGAQAATTAEQNPPADAGAVPPDAVGGGSGDAAPTVEPASSAAGAVTTPTAADEFARQLQLIQENQQFAESLGLALGWQNGQFRRSFGADSGFGDGLTKLIGLLLTGLALSAGASFWFDLLNQLVRLRTSLKPDRQEPAAGNDAGDETTKS